MSSCPFLSHCRLFKGNEPLPRLRFSCRDGPRPFESLSSPGPELMSDLGELQQAPARTHRPSGRAAKMSRSMVPFASLISTGLRLMSELQRGPGPGPGPLGRLTGPESDSDSGSKRRCPAGAAGAAESLAPDRRSRRARDQPQWGRGTGTARPGPGPGGVWAACSRGGHSQVSGPWQNLSCCGRSVRQPEL